MAMTYIMSSQEQKARRFMAIAGTLGVVGIAFNLNGDGTLPKILAAAGIAALIWSIHRFGRLGPDAVMSFAEPEPSEAPRKKKKKKKKPAEAEAPQDSESNDGL
jgi:hypothetical protein